MTVILVSGLQYKAEEVWQNEEAGYLFFTTKCGDNKSIHAILPEDVKEVLREYAKEMVSA